MTHTTTLLADHHGVAKPKASGIEYYAEAEATFTDYDADPGEVFNASEFGLSSITSVSVIGFSDHGTKTVVVEVSSTGAYASASSFKLYLYDMSPAYAENGGTFTGTVRFRVTGLL